MILTKHKSAASERIFVAAQEPPHHKQRRYVPLSSPFLTVNLRGGASSAADGKNGGAKSPLSPFVSYYSTYSSPAKMMPLSSSYSNPALFRFGIQFSLNYCNLLDLILFLDFSNYMFWERVKYTDSVLTTSLSKLTLWTF